MAWIGGLIAGGAALVGGYMSNESKANQAEDANAFSAEQYAKRWQTTTADMKAAGLNPMLAYTQGVGSSPSGQQADQSDIVTPAVNAFNQYSQNKLATAQVANVEADTNNKEAQKKLLEAQASAALASANQANSQSQLNDAKVRQAVEEVKNIPIEGDRLRAVIMNPASSTGLNEANEVYTREQWTLVRAQVQKILSETGLLNADLDAVKRLDNIGGIGKQLKPAIDVVRSIIGHR